MAGVFAAPPTVPVDGAVRRALRRESSELTSALDALCRNPDALVDAAQVLLSALQEGHAILVAGNGGSAAEAQHFAAELVGRFKREREPYAALALTTDTAALTAIANDYGYADVFARQVAALGRRGDVFLAFSTSGESENLVRAAGVASRLGMAIVAMTGEKPSRLSRAANVAVRAPAISAATVQELHMAMTHLLCEVVEEGLAGGCGG